ncbi:hypothetical protein [Roseibium sp.]|uniref:hypothetical protein n=1 Tax=Roseibium sp. TaxID=1936156 RepID=UPI003A96BD67
MISARLSVLAALDNVDRLAFDAPVDAKSGLSIFSSVGNAYHDLMVVSFLMSQKRQEA